MNPSVSGFPGPASTPSSRPSSTVTDNEQVSGQSSGQAVVRDSTSRASPTTAIPRVYGGGLPEQAELSDRVALLGQLVHRGVDPGPRESVDLEIGYDAIRAVRGRD